MSLQCGRLTPLERCLQFHSHLSREAGFDVCFLMFRLGSGQVTIDPTLKSDPFGIVLEVAVRLALAPHRLPRFNMRQENWGFFNEAAEELLRDADLELPLDEYAMMISNIILQAADRAIPCVKLYTRRYRDAWIYGPRVRELNRWVNTACKIYHRNLSPAARRYLQSVVRHVQTDKARLRDEAWLEWCRSVGAHTTLGEMWRRVRAMYS